jgi:hypothetical protein
MKILFIIQGFILTLLVAIFFISESTFKIVFQSYPIVTFIIILSYLGSLLWLTRLFFETYYDEVLKIFSIVFILFFLIQVILLGLIYFGFSNYTYALFEKIIFYNLIWAVPLVLLFIFARKKCPICKSFETITNSKLLKKRYIETIYSGGYNDTDSETREEIYEYLTEIHFKCTNCTHEVYSYKLSRDNSSWSKTLSAEEAKAYLKKHDLSLTDTIIAGLMGFYFLG